MLFFKIFKELEKEHVRRSRRWSLNGGKENDHKKERDYEYEWGKWYII